MLQYVGISFVSRLYVDNKQYFLRHTSQAAHFIKTNNDNNASVKKTTSLWYYMKQTESM